MPTGVPSPDSHIVDAAFALHGDDLPVDHGYALSRVLFVRSGFREMASISVAIF